MIVPPAPMPIAMFPIMTVGTQAERALGRVGRANCHDEHPEEDDARAVRDRRQDVEREDPVVEGHERDPTTVRPVCKP